MHYRTNPKNNDALSILGFGCMRFPTTEKGEIDPVKGRQIINTAIESGVNYFDTAYIYHKGKSESFLGQVLAESNQRQNVKIATKLLPYMVKNLEQAQKIFFKQCERLQTDYIDYYLLHMLTDKASLDKLIQLGVMEWLEQQKNSGAIKNIGFSFHGSKNNFPLILEAYPWDFCQIQYNYIDENHQASRSGLDLAYQKNIPLIIMEPLRGGRLADNLPPDALTQFSYHPTFSPAQWALLWLWNHPEILVVLSGMTTLEQLNQNVTAASSPSALPNHLESQDHLMFEEVKKSLHKQVEVPCTACGYCLPCPAGVDIPTCFSVYNDKFRFQNKASKFTYLQNLGLTSAAPAYSSLCTSCGKCISRCPQSIDIPTELKKVKKQLEWPFFSLTTSVLRKFFKI